MKTVCTLLFLLQIGFAQAQEARNAGGSTIGYIKNDGEVRNAGGSTIGYVKDDGEIRNAGGSTIGYARYVNRQWSGAAFFFFFFDKKNEK